MQTISIKYSLIWQIKFAPHYKWSACKKLFNVRTGRQVKKVLNGGSVGYWIAGKFYSLKKLKELKLVEKITTTKIPL